VNHHRLQADEEGYYLPLAEFTVEEFQFNGFSLHPEAMVIFSRVTDSIQHPSAPCQRALIRPDTVHLVCPYQGLGTVTVDGVFPIKETEDASSGPRFVGFVTVSAGGRTLYQKKHAFSFTIGE